MTAALEPIRLTSFGEAKLAVAEQLCATELEAQSWRLRCFQAEAQLRLQRLQRRGEQHPRWPQDAAAQQQLQNSYAALKALDFTSIVQETLRDVVLTRTSVGHLQDLLEQTSREVAELEEDAATKRARAISLSEGAASEDATFENRERELEEHKEKAREISEKLRQRFVLENDLAEQVALGQDQVERLQREIQAFLPSQQQMQQEARQAQQESDKARSLAQRRREAVSKLEEEAQQVERSAEEEQATMSARLEQMRTDLNETVASTTELGEQARKAQSNHNRQMKAVKTDGSALRDALADVGQEKEDMEVELSRLRDTVGSAAAEDRGRRERLAEAEASRQALLQQVALEERSLNQAEAANAEASGTRADTIEEGLQQARLALSRAEQEAAQVSEEAQEALRTLEALCAERTRMKGETGPEAAKRRVQLAEALTKEEDQLSAEQEQLKVQSKSAEEKLDWLRHLRDVQEYARSAAKESANNFRVAYTDIAKSSRSSTARPAAGTSGTSPAPEAANRSARRLSRHLDDFLRFMAEVVAVGEAHEETSQLPLQQMVNLNLPAVLKEAYMGKFVQSDDGMSQAQQLDSSKEKLKVLKRELNDAGHQNETQSLTKDLAELRRQIAEGEAKSREDRQRCEEAQQRLREGFKKAGYRRNEAQTHAVQKVQRELGSFEREVALLRRERDALKAETPVAPVAPSIESLGNKLQQKETEVQELRNRVMSTRERYHALVEESGGRTAVEDLGFNVRYGTPRPLHRPGGSPPRRPAGQALGGKTEMSRSVEGRIDVNKSVDEGRPDVAKVATESGRPDLSKGIEEGESTGRLSSEGKADMRAINEGKALADKDAAPEDVAVPAGSAEGNRSTDDGSRDEVRFNDGGASPSNKDSENVDDKDITSVTSAVTPATPAASPIRTVSETPQAVPAATNSIASTTPVQASPSSPGRSSRALSTPWGEMEAAKPESTPQSCSELASPSQLNSALAEIRRSEALSLSTPPLSPGQSVLRLEAAPSVPAESRLPSQVETVEVSSPARSIRPALAMSWADMEAAALEPLEPSPNSGASEPQSPSGPSLSSPGLLRAKEEAEPAGRPEPALQCQWQPQPAPPAPAPPAQPVQPASAEAQNATPLWEPVTAMPRQAMPQSNAGNASCLQTLSPQLVASQPVQSLQPMPVYQALHPGRIGSISPTSQTFQTDGRVRVPSPPPVYLAPARAHSPVTVRTRSPSPHATEQVSMAMNWTHIGREASQFATLPEFPALPTSPAVAVKAGTALRRPSDFALSPRALSPRGLDTSPGISSRPSDLSPGTGADSDICSSSDVSRDVLGSPVSGGLVDDPWLGLAVRSPLRSPGREFRDVARPAHSGPLRRPVPTISSPEWAEQAAGGKPVLPAPQLPALEELFAQNMREQRREERKLRHQRREPRQQMQRTVHPSFEEVPNGLCGFGPNPDDDDYFYGKHVSL